MNRGPGFYFYNGTHPADMDKQERLQILRNLRQPAHSYFEFEREEMERARVRKRLLETFFEAIVIDDYEGEKREYAVKTKSAVQNLINTLQWTTETVPGPDDFCDVLIASEEAALLQNVSWMASKFASAANRE